MHLTFDHNDTSCISFIVVLQPPMIKILIMVWTLEILSPRVSNRMATTIFQQHNGGKPEGGCFNNAYSDKDGQFEDSSSRQVSSL